MKRYQKLVLAFAGAILSLAILSLLAPSTSVAQGTSWCQCVKYVENKFGLSGAPNAKDWNDGFLQGKGFHQIYYPQTGAIVVFEAGVAGADVNYGHVGVLEGFKDVSNGPLQLNVRSTNQPGSQQPPEVNCNNVTVWSNQANVRGLSGVTYWVLDTLGVQYQAHVAGNGWQNSVFNGATAGTTGQSLRMEAIKISLTNPPSGAKICYQAHVAGYGWQGEVCDGAVAGTTGESRQMEAIKIRLVNAPYGAKICYQAHVAGNGWQNEVCDGAVAGTIGESRQMEAIQIKVKY